SSAFSPAPSDSHTCKIGNLILSSSLPHVLKKTPPNCSLSPVNSTLNSMSTGINFGKVITPWTSHSDLASCRLSAVLPPNDTDPFYCFIVPRNLPYRPPIRKFYLPQSFEEHLILHCSCSGRKVR